MREMREHILRDDFLSYYEKKRLDLVRTDEANPSRPPKKTKTTRPTRLGDYEIHRSAQGFYSIRQLSSGEVMHSVNTPSEEAQRLYIEQSCLATRLVVGRIDFDDGIERGGRENNLARDNLLMQHSASADALVIWDVGLGAAFNAMAAIHCFEQCYAGSDENALRQLHLVSFECDLDPLTLAADNPDCFFHLRHAAPMTILKSGTWKHASGLLRWELHRGDFRERLESAPIPDFIFYDPFSFKTDSALWTPETFARIFNRCAPKSAELYTYSASTAVRVALLSAGFFVAEGIGTGPKAATTIAFTRATGGGEHPLAPPLLGRPWLTRWQRSHAKSPPTLTHEEKSDFEKRIETHPQFCTP
jgi:queuine tRNA-ribosyltransferase